MHVFYDDTAIQPMLENVVVGLVLPNGSATKLHIKQRSKMSRAFLMLPNGTAIRNNESALLNVPLSAQVVEPAHSLCLPIVDRDDYCTSSSVFVRSSQNRSPLDCILGSSKTLVASSHSTIDDYTNPFHIRNTAVATHRPRDPELT